MPKLHKKRALPTGKVIVACMRDEALFVVEWVAHHLALGFDRIIVFTNDCSDGTDALLKAMAAALPVEHYDNPGPYTAGTIQKQALEMAFDLPQVRQAEWVLHIDADEYLNVTVGNRRIDDLIALFPDVDAIAIQWRHFGSAGVAQWQPGSVVETFTRCEAEVPVPGANAEIGFKTLFRPQKFKMMGVHTPKLPWRKRVPVVVNTAGTPMPIEALMSRRKSGYKVEAAHCTWANACLHHHHVKSDDLHLLKHARGDANGRKNKKRVIGSSFYQLVNRNEVENTSLVGLRPAVEPIEAQIRALPQVAQLEATALAWFRTRFQDMEQGAAAIAAEEAALDWLRERMDALRHSAGAAGFEQAAALWFRRLLVRLDEVDDTADEVLRDDMESGAAASE
ncbi:MAG: hypothetical protein RIT52_247 [Pseudomonadota bacterium]